MALANLEHWLVPSAETDSADDHEALLHWDIERILAITGAGECYAVSDLDELDDGMHSIRKALEYLDRNESYGTLLSFVPGRLALYEQSERTNLRRWVRTAR